MSGGAPDGDRDHDLVQVGLEAAGDLQQGAALPVPARTHHAELLARTLTRQPSGQIFTADGAVWEADLGVAVSGRLAPGAMSPW